MVEHKLKLNGFEVMEALKNKSFYILRPIKEGMSIWEGQSEDDCIIIHQTDDVFGEKLCQYVRCPYGHITDNVWIQEVFATVNSEEGPSLLYKADSLLVPWRSFSTSFGPDFGAGPSMDYDSYPGDYCMWWTDLLNKCPGHKWTAAGHMPRWASRMDLVIKDIKVDRTRDKSTQWSWVIQLESLVDA
jgi:hypothetical protein